jgi:hypothetical protein
MLAPLQSFSSGSYILPASALGVSAGVTFGNEGSSMQAGRPQAERPAMTAEVIGAVIIFLVIGSVLGWHGHTTYAAHGDVKVAKTRLRGGRKTRWRSGVWVLAIGVVIALATWDVIMHSH